MGNETKQGPEATETSREEVVVPKVNEALYRQFCERAKALGVQPESILTEIVDRGMAEWLRMRSG